MKATVYEYKVNKSQGGANIESISNRFINIKQSSPNLPPNINLNFYRKGDLV